MTQASFLTDSKPKPSCSPLLLINPTVDGYLLLGGISHEDSRSIHNRSNR